MRWITSFALVICFSLVACDRKDTAPEAAPTAGVTLKIVGSSTMTPLVSELAKHFQAAHPVVDIKVESGGSGRGISEVRAGTTDIGMVARALSDKERDLLGFAIARDGLGFIVHKDNEVRTLSTAQLRDIFSGRIVTWSAVGGADAKVAVIARAEGRASTEVFTRHFKLDRAQIKSVSTASDNDDATRAIERDRNAITFGSVGEAERKRDAGALIRLLKVDGVEASSENIRSGKYVLSRGLTLVTRSLPRGPAKEFIDFALSPQAVPLIRKYDFVAYVD